VLESTMRVTRTVIASMVVVAVVAGGCLPYRTSRGAARGSLYVAGAGVLLFAGGLAQGPCEPTGEDGCGAPSTGDFMMAGGAVVVAAGLAAAFLFVLAAKPQTAAEHATRPPPPPPAPAPPPPPPAPPDPAELTIRARYAARQRQCAAVQRLAARVEAADRAYYETTFVADRDIARCLVAADAPDGP
jgi:hypothetical protein